MVNLYVNYYQSPNPVRDKELYQAFENNVFNTLIDRIIILSNEVHQFSIKKAELIQTISRPSFNELFKATSKYPDDINIVSNLDIYFSNLEVVQDFYSRGNDKTCLALTRWEDSSTIHPNAHGSQDVWMFKGSVAPMDGADITMGTAGCDNKIAWIIENNGYKVINPCKSVKCIHVHKSNFRTYNIVEDRKKIRPPFKVILPTTL